MNLVNSKNIKLSIFLAPSTGDWVKLFLYYSICLERIHVIAVNKNILK